MGFFSSSPVRDEISEWREIGSTPIRSDAPSGDSARYDPRFEQVQAEIDKLGAISGGAVQWKEVVGLGRELLQKKSKDLLVAHYVSVGLLDQRGYAGLLAGLSCCEEMIKSFWEILYPEAKRMRARINAIIWFSEKGGAVVGQRMPLPGEAKEIRACSEKISLLEKYLSEKLGKDSPGLGNLRRAIDQWSKEVETAKGTPARSDPSQQSSSTAPEQASLAAPVMKLESIEDAERVLSEAGDRIRSAADLVRAQDLAKPWPYQMVRSLIWSKFGELPTHTEWDTRVPAPPSHLLESRRLLIERREWKELLELTEMQFQEHPFWLDLHRVSELALTNLGSRYTEAKQTVLGEVRILLQRLPDLPRCRFADGTPFADEETQRWIDSEVLSQSGGRASTGQSVGAPFEGKEEIAEIRAQADQLVGIGEVKGAIALYHEQIPITPAGRQRSLLQLELAQLCLNTGYPKVALSQLDVLLQQIDRFSMEEWEPALSLEVLLLSWRVLNKLSQDFKQGSSDWATRADLIYGRICRLDPIAGLELDRK